MIQQRTVPAVLILMSVLCTAAESQDAAQAPYQPLFTDAMIDSAAPEQRERMRAAEENNRRAYERRRQDAGEDAAASAATPASAAPPTPTRPRSGRIYKWVDDKGRVHFGDAPAGKGAEEITVRSSSPSPPPSPAPNSDSTPRAPIPDNPSRQGGDSRNQRRGS